MRYAEGRTYRFWFTFDYLGLAREETGSSKGLPNELLDLEEVVNIDRRLLHRLVEDLESDTTNIVSPLGARLVCLKIRLVLPENVGISGNSHSYGLVPQLLPHVQSCRIGCIAAGGRRLP